VGRDEDKNKHVYQDVRDRNNKRVVLVQKAGTLVGVRNINRTVSRNMTLDANIVSVDS
jgi:hypothetical protein